MPNTKYTWAFNSINIIKEFRLSSQMMLFCLWMILSQYLELRDDDSTTSIDNDKPYKFYSWDEYSGL